MATAIATGLAALLEKRRKQGAAALVIAEAYKRSLIRRRQKEFVQLIIRVRASSNPMTLNRSAGVLAGHFPVSAP